MSTVTFLDDYFSTGPGEAEVGVRITNHVTHSNAVKNKIVLEHYLFSLLIEGTKAVHTIHNSLTIENDKFLLFLPGHYLMTERITSSNARFHAVLISFSQKFLHVFFSKYGDAISGKGDKSSEQVQIFSRDRFLNNFIDSLLLMQGDGIKMPASLQNIKLEELLLYLGYHYPEKMEQLKTRASMDVTEMEMKNLVESNIGNSISLEELAFLCHMSVSTFKRRFFQLYGIAPGKWFLLKRMELATTLLKSGREKPSEIYFKVGYESHSSFTHSFKQVFGLTPTQYQEKKFA